MLLFLLLGSVKATRPLLLSLLCEESRTSLPTWESSANSDVQDSLGLGLDEQKVQAFAASKFGARELCSLIFKGGQLAAINLVSRAALLAAKKYCIDYLERVGFFH
ncbi:hypothetical protein NL676_039158 [Syzygium grande]|nr:hypothetical protein NL676_039158 [Syzygium grande]